MFIPWTAGSNIFFEFQVVLSLHLFFSLSTMIANGYQIIMRQKAGRRPLLENIWPEVFPMGFPLGKTLTEISGQPATGKSLILYHIMARAVIPREYGGKSSKVIFIDAKHKTGVVDFKKCLLNVALDTANANNPPAEPDVLNKCLESVIYLACYSTEQFQIALDDLEDLLWDHGDVALLAIDGLDTFYWEDCYRKVLRMSTHYHKLCQRIKPICQESNISCMYTLDTNYLKRRHKYHPPSNLVDYKLNMVMKNNGRRYLNGKTFCIVGGNSGHIKFIK